MLGDVGEEEPEVLFGAVDAGLDPFGELLQPPRPVHVGLDALHHFVAHPHLVEHLQRQVQEYELENVLLVLVAEVLQLLLVVVYEVSQKADLVRALLLAHGGDKLLRLEQSQRVQLALVFVDRPLDLLKMVVGLDIQAGLPQH